ncbi:type II CAAX prenyl endopeptidase Rce1 family protein [Belliella kenyensis]|uniref:Type II CAAX prenyl endopeptidase Rce1 family protein n=1 Tax=Belliella kenyensis TaxID=1472724 RepID=A0ABV8EIF1_9BACT|nr:CPBP family glutamic-type intramembrane protease [Belliella kenyensis]MCH7401285.1 CPBP family glutamic-type intramembrane protease [Belliella kenyensis]
MERDKFCKYDYFKLLLFKISILCFFIVFIEVFSLDFEDEDFDYNLFKKDIFIILFGGAILFPLYEEILFRFYLSNKRGTFIFPILFSCVNIFFAVEEGFMAKIIFYSMYLLYILYLFFAFSNIKMNLKIAVFGSSLFFSVAHVFNYNLESLNFLDGLKILLAVFPQLVGGLLLCYVRIKYGLFYSFSFHAIWNFILLIVLIFIMKFIEI